MSISTTVPRAALLIALAVQGLSAGASPLTLNTTGLDANATLKLSQDAIDLLTLTSISVSAGGKATALGGNAFHIPITSLTVDVKLLPPTLAPTKALAAGSSLTLSDALTGGRASFANLALDFNTLSISGDITTPTGSQSKVPLFAFKVTQPLTFSLQGGVSLTESLGGLYLTEGAAQAFAQGLKVPDSLVPLFTQVNFGTIDARIVPWFRSTATAAALPVPEVSTGAMWALSLLGLMLIRRRA